MSPFICIQKPFHVIAVVTSLYYSRSSSLLGNGDHQELIGKGHTICLDDENAPYLDLGVVTWMVWEDPLEKGMSTHSSILVHPP